MCSASQPSCGRGPRIRLFIVLVLLIKYYTRGLLFNFEPVAHLHFTPLLHLMEVGKL